jgi:hypothetical protein
MMMMMMMMMNYGNNDGEICTKEYSSWSDLKKK